MQPSRVLAGHEPREEATEVEFHEYDEIIRTLVRITAHQDLISQNQDLINQQQRLINQRLELTLQAIREIRQRGDGRQEQREPGSLRHRQACPQFRLPLLPRPHVGSHPDFLRRPS